MAVLPLEVAEAPAMQVNLLHCSTNIASASEEDLNMCSTSCTYTCTSCMLPTIIESETEFWTCCVGDVLHKYTNISVKHVCTRNSPAFAIDQEISVPVMPCSAFMKIIAELATATCTHSIWSRLLHLISRNQVGGQLTSRESSCETGGGTPGRQPRSSSLYMDVPATRIMNPTTCSTHSPL